jgi:hypothetical protein
MRKQITFLVLLALAGAFKTYGQKMDTIEYLRAIAS